MTEELFGPGKSPCGSCPYRRDIASGVWDRSEYEKLFGYDGEPIDQAMAGATALFFCHQQDGKLCAGWVGCHNDPEKQNIALRINSRSVTPETFSYESPVPLFGSGAEAATHGLRDIEHPGEDADRIMNKLTAKGLGGGPLDKE